MAGRNPARFLAPLALVAFVVAFYVVVSSGIRDKGDEVPASNARPTATATPAKDKGRKRKRRVYVVKPGDTPSQIAEKTGVTLEQLEQANPSLDPQLLAPGQRIKLPQMMLAARLLLVLAALAASAAVAARPAAAAAPACPASDLAPSAIVIEVSTGAVACERAADARRSIASTTKLMTALLTLERAKLSETFTAARYFAAGPESKIGLEPGERMSVRDLLRGLLIESGNDAAVTLAEGGRGRAARSCGR